MSQYSYTMGVSQATYLPYSPPQELPPSTSKAIYPLLWGFLFAFYKKTLQCLLYNLYNILSYDSLSYAPRYAGCC